MNNEQHKEKQDSWVSFSDIFRLFVNKLHNKGFQRYASNIGWMFFARISTMIIALVATAYTARNLGPKNYGELSYAISFVGVISFFANLGIEQILCRELVKHPEKRNEYLGSALTLKFLASVVSFTACSLIAFLFSPKDVSLYLILIVGLSPVVSTFTLISYELQADLKSKLPSIFSILITLLLNALKIIVIFFDKGVIYLASIILLEPVLYSIMYIYIHITLYGPLSQLRFNADIAKNLFKDSFPLMFASAFFMIYARIDQIMIKNMIDTQSVGLYDAAVRMSEISYFIPNLIVAGLFPAIVNAKNTSEVLYLKRVKKLLILLILISGAVAVGTTILAKYITLIIYGVSFLGAVSVLKIYVWSNIGTALNLFTQQILITENLTKHISFTLFFGMLINVALNIFLIPKYGMEGAAFASLVSYAIPFFSMFFTKKLRTLILAILRA